MSLQIDIDPHGMNRIPFPEVRARLIALDRTFTEPDLRLLPYDQIILAATANAGKAACSLEEVVAEKKRRRDRFLHLTPDELESTKTYLRIECMYADVCAALLMHEASPWDTLSPRARLWFKLNCLHTHIDDPLQRLFELFPLIEACESQGQLRRENASRMSSIIDKLTWVYPEAMDEDTFRSSLGSLAEEVLGYLDDADKAHCQRELVADYSCTSDCYHAIGVPE